MLISGTITNQIRLMALDTNWQIKKENLNKKNKEDMTQEEIMLSHFQEEAEEIRENRIPAAIDAKLEAGEKLTQEEIEYLKKHNPEALKEYEEIQMERESYKKKLKRCKSKEEVEKLKMTKMGEFLSQAKTISNDPYIPKSKKCALLKKILKKAAGIEAEHQKFIESSKYASLPDEDDEKKKKDEKPETEMTEQPEPADILSTEFKDPAQELKTMISLKASESTAENTSKSSFEGTIGDTENSGTGTDSGRQAEASLAETGTGSLSGMDVYA